MKPRKKFKNYRFGNFLMDIFFGTLLVLLAICGALIFKGGCETVMEYFQGTLKDNWVMLALPISIFWLYFNLRWIYYMIYLTFAKVEKAVVRIDKIVDERVSSTRGGSYRIWNVYYKDGVFEVSRSEAEEIQEGQHVEVWYKDDRKGKSRRHVAVYI